MTASAAEHERAIRPAVEAARCARAGAILLSLLLCACVTPGALPLGSPLEPLPSFSHYVPDELDHAAARVAAAALAPDSHSVHLARLELEVLERERRERQDRPSGLAPVAHLLTNATLDDHFDRRAATRELLERDDVDPALRRRLQERLDDDPLRLAERRLSDGRRARFARIFNTLIEPLSRSLLSFSVPPLGFYRMGRAFLTLVIQEHLQEPISVVERQALAHWKRHVDAHPQSPEAARLVNRIEGLQSRWYDMKRERGLGAAKDALEAGHNRIALVLANRTLRYAPEDGDATRVRDRAERRLELQRADLRRSLDASEQAPLDLESAGARELAIALLAPDGDVAERARALLNESPDGPLADVARFTEALALGESGNESDMWEMLADLAHQDVRRSSMARHASALVESPTRNPYAAFRAAEARERRQRTAFLFFGELARGPRDRNLPRPVEWMIDAPNLVGVLTGFPNRVVRAAFWSSSDRRQAVSARGYLARHPEGEHSEELRDWLIDFEKDRGNVVEAHRLAAEDDEIDAEELEELREQAARQSLEAARRHKRADVRFALLRHTAREYAETDAGHSAGQTLREELEKETSQRIRISRGFLLENPEVAGPSGLGMRPGLLDDEASNGELHPDGVFLIGGRTLEFALLDTNADPASPPRLVRRRVSDERLARIVALLEESSLQNALVDRDASFDADADRDLYFERARLGVADRPDRRAAARSTYAFTSMRERYGWVRSRESILPVEIVIKGSLPDLSLGAFPRIPPPKATPDAILYK